MTENSEFQTIPVVYLGRRVDGKHQLMDMYIPLALYFKPPEEGFGIGQSIDNRASAFAYDRKIKHIVGGVYDIECKLNEMGRISTARIKAGKFKERLDNTEVQKLDAVDSSEYARHRAFQKLEKMRNADTIAPLLDPVRDLYAKLPYQDRLAFQLMVINYITRS